MNKGSMNEPRYAMQDGNWNTIAICDTTGSVGERYAYSAYGAPVFMTGAGVVQTSSPIGFETLYAGYRWDNPAPQMYYVRNRFLLPQVGTWNRRDPLGYVDGMGLYATSVTSPVTYVDSSGLRVLWCARDLDGVPAGNHHYLVLIPDNPGDFEDEVFINLLKHNAPWGTTLGGHNVDGRLVCIRNQIGDVAATREKFCSRCYHDPKYRDKYYYKYGWTAECHIILPPPGMTDSDFIRRLLHKAHSYENKPTSELPEFVTGFGGGAQNCACWVNTILRESGVSNSVCQECGEFEGFDWGEEKLLNRKLFLSEEELWEEQIKLWSNPNFRLGGGVGSSTGGMPGGEPGRGGGLIYQNR